MKTLKSLLMFLGGIVLLLLLVFGAFTGYTKLATGTAESRAREFCSSIPPDADMAGALKKARSWKPAPDRISPTEKHGFLVLTWKGALQENWSCVLQFEDGKPVEKKIDSAD